MAELNNTSPNKNTSPIDPPKKTFRSIAEKINKPNEFTNLGKAYSNKLYYNTGFGNSKYDKELNFDAQFNELDPIGSINENRAQSESNLAKISAGIGRIGTKAVSEIAKMPGVVGGIIAAPFAEEGEGWETAFNNQWIKSISQFNEDINSELLPVYVKKAVSEGNLWDNVSSIDFWATEGADGVGFIASMLAPGAALKSLNLGHKVLGTTAKGLSMVNGEAKLAGAVRTLEGLGITANNIDLGAMTMANTLFESGSEAGSAMESFEKNKQNYINKRSLEKFAELDRQRRSGQITNEEYNNLSALVSEQVDKEFNDQKARLGRDIFVSNLAILLVPNAIQTKMIWGKGVGNQLVKDTPSLITKVGNRGKNVLGALGSEGFLEEGTQSTVETMFTNKANKGELTDNMLKDFNVSELVSSYIDTLNTTDGQKAIFLGGVLGGGMSAYQGGKSDIATRKQTQDVLSLAEEKVGVFNRINETDVYKRNAEGDIIYNTNNQPQYDPVKVRDVAKTLNYTEQQSELFDQAIQEGNEQVIQTLKNEAINQLITPFINRGELGIQALSQYLDTTLQTEEIAQNEDAKTLKSKIIEKATYMQDQLNTYRDFSKSLINLNNPNATPQDITDYYNMLGDLYINLKGSEYSQKEELRKLNNQKSKLLKDLGTNEVDRELNENFIEGTSEDIYKFKKKETDPRVKLLNDQIEFVEKEIAEIDEIINGVIWNNEDVNKQFAEHIKDNNKLREQDSLENEAIVNAATETIANATTVDELNNLPKTNTPADVVIQQQANVKKAEIIATEEAFNETEREIAIQEDNDFNNITPYDGLTATEGSIITDELIPQEAENNTVEELKSIENSEVDNGLGVKVISTDRNTGLPLQFISEQFPLYLEYEREPVNKSGKEVGFEINQNPGKNPKVLEALNAFNNKDFSNPKLLIDFLPINVQFTNEVKAPIETRRVTGEINPATELLRTEIINHLIKGGSITDIKTTIQDQYKGVLKVDNNRFANNNILQLDGVKDLNYIRENLYVVNSFGKLQNILNDKIFEFNNDKIKPNASGEIYLTIPQANGKPFPLKLNIKKINEGEAVLLYEIYKEIITNAKSLDTTISEIDNDLQEAILKNFESELNIIGGNKNDIKLQEIIDLLIYQSNNIKSRMRIEDNSLLFGENVSTIDTIEQDQNDIINFLVNSKRHQIKINPKSETDNTKTNLKSNSADYLKYLIDNNILSTNAVVNEPTFQGYTNIYLNTGITVNNQTQSVQNNNKADIEIRKQALKDLMKATGVEIYEMAVEDGSFNREGFLDMNSNGNVILTRFADTSENLTKGGQILSPEEIKKGANNHSYKSISTSAIEGGVVSYAKEGGVIGKYEIPLNELVSLMKEGYVYFAGIGNKEFVLSPHIAKKYLISINGKQIINQPKVSEAGVEVNSNNFKGLNFGNDFENNRKKELNILDNLKIGDIVTYPIKGSSKDNLQFTKAKVIEFDKTTGEISLEGKNIMGVPGGIYDINTIRNFTNIKYDILSSTNIQQIPNKQPIISEQGVEVKTDNTGFDSLFEKEKTIEEKAEEFWRNNVDEKGYPKETLSEVIKRFKNNQENVRNVQENFVSLSEATFQNIKEGDVLIKYSADNKGFIKTYEYEKIVKSIKPGSVIFTDGTATGSLVNYEIKKSNIEFQSLSEIPGTVENTEIKETQNKVFNEKRTLKQRQTDFRRMDVLFKKKQEGKLTTEKELRDFEMFKQMYPQEYEKRCK